MIRAGESPRSVRTRLRNKDMGDAFNAQNNFDWYPHVT